MPVLICLLLIMHFFLFKSQVHIAIQIPKAHGATILPPFWNDVLRTSQGLPSIAYIFASTNTQVKLNIEVVEFKGASLSERTRNRWRSFGALFFAWLLAGCYSAEVGRGCWWPGRSTVQEISKDWRRRSSSKKLSPRHHVNIGSRPWHPTSLRDRGLISGTVRGMKRRKVCRSARPHCQTTSHSWSLIAW